MFQLILRETFETSRPWITIFSFICIQFMCLVLDLCNWDTIAGSGLI